MNRLADSWAAQQLTEYLTRLGTCEDVGAALRIGLERAAEAFEAEAGVVVRDGDVVAATGFGAGRLPDRDWVGLGARSAGIPGLGTAAAVAAPLDDAGTGWIALARDGEEFSVEESALLRGMARALAQTLRTLELVAEAVHRGLHDPLTNLPNRALFLDRLQQATHRARRAGDPVGVLFVDLDGFKTINDSLGHAGGDELLVAVAERVTSVLRAGDTAARLGGDEFAILLEGLSDEREALIVAERVTAALRAPFAVGGLDVRVRASIGVATGEGDLLRDADVAMYQAKAQGRDRVAVFDCGMHDALVERVALENDLRRALEDGELRLAYQPIVDLAHGRLLAVEALLRWRHPTRGDVPPGAFVPLAEETGLIVPIGTWVLEEACRTAAGWVAVPVTVNVSSVQLRSAAFPSVVAAALEASGLPAERLIVEITESVLMTDVERTARLLAELKALGVRIAIDDFGTGHSSLQYLQQLPLDMLKIPKTFVDDLGRGGGVVARAILDLGRSFGLEVVAEGIEEDVQRERLLALGCTSGQGFLFARPMPARELAVVGVDPQRELA
jgi:diguanylate cyclase